MALGSALESGCLQDLGGRAEDRRQCGDSTGVAGLNGRIGRDEGQWPKKAVGRGRAVELGGPVAHDNTRLNKQEAIQQGTTQKRNNTRLWGESLCRNVNQFATPRQMTRSVKIGGSTEVYTVLR